MKGIIIDVRNNGGGSSANAEVIATRFADQKILAAKYLYKNGPEHDDFAPAKDFFLEPRGNKAFLKPVVVLTNRSCYSATNYFVLLMRSLPQVTILGDKTGGGGGIPIYSELSNGWRFRFSASITLAPDGFNVEHGIEPDIYQDMTDDDLINNTDSILEKALEIIKNQN